MLSSRRSIFRLSIEAELISSYLVILGVGGLATSVLGSWIVSSTIMMQARRSVSHDFATTKTVYDQRLESLRLPVEYAASGSNIRDELAGRRHDLVSTRLQTIRKRAAFDFLSVADQHGKVIIRTLRPDLLGDDVSSIEVVKAALSGKVAAATEALSAPVLASEDPELLRRARFNLDGRDVHLGMALVVAAPVLNREGVVQAVLYGGALLSRNPGIVDRVWDLLFKEDRFKDENAGSVTIFQSGVRISTNVRDSDNQRAVGTLAPPEAYDVVFNRGLDWRGRAWVVRQWYMSEYGPVRDYNGRVIGMLGVGLMESTYASIRNRVVSSFLIVAVVGFVLIIAITYYMIRKITHPLADMVMATRSIGEGRFDQEVHCDSPIEIALLADSFNLMLKRLRQMRSDLEEWGRTLEQKVKLRTEELGAMQLRVAQSERLASLGMLAAGVAHEVNNPLGGILALTALTLEDMPKDHPDRENLQEVIRQTERCRDIVKGLLAFSRQSRSNQELVDLNRILRETLALMSQQAMFFNIQVVKNWGENLPAVLGDGSQLQQVFMNMLMNAAQAMNERGTIVLTTRHDAPAHCVEVALSDTGCGIPPEQVSRIFDPFFTTKDSGEGTGLGLSIAYGIITAHRGTISVQSEVGKGTTFTVRLPAVEGREEGLA